MLDDLEYSRHRQANAEQFIALDEGPQIRICLTNLAKKVIEGLTRQILDAHHFLLIGYLTVVAGHLSRIMDHMQYQQTLAGSPG
jgi:hypothetical protein